jgi:hypothetical protein
MDRSGASRLARFRSPNSRPVDAQQADIRLRFDDLGYVRDAARDKTQNSIPSILSKTQIVCPGEKYSHLHALAR